MIYYYHYFALNFIFNTLCFIILENWGHDKIPDVCWKKNICHVVEGYIHCAIKFKFLFTKWEITDFWGPGSVFQIPGGNSIFSVTLTPLLCHVKCFERQKYIHTSSLVISFLKALQNSSLSFPNGFFVKAHFW